MAIGFDIALTHLAHRKRQTLISVLGVALGVGFFVAMTSMMRGFQEDFVNRVIENSPHITIKDEFRDPPRQPARMAYPLGAVRLRGVRPRDEVRGIKRARRIIALLNRRQGLVAAPTLQGQLFLRYGAKDVSANLIGIDPDKERRVTRLEKDIVNGSLDILKASPNGIILGIGVARRLGVEVNDTVTAVSPAGVRMRMKVVGLLQTAVVAIDDTTAYALIKKAQVLHNRINVINQIRVRVAKVETARAVAARIEARFRYKAESWQEANEGVLGIFAIQDAVRYSVTGAILVVACFGIFNIISTVIFEKYRDIAILKSMGFAPGDIQRIFLLEGFGLGIAGSVTGWGVGYGLISLMASIRFEVGGIVELQGFVLSYSVWHYVIATAIAVAAATLAAYLPARRAARLNPVDIIRGAA